MVTVIPGPFTMQAKQAAIQREVRQHYEAYFAQAAKTRMWFPDRLPQRKEMAKYSHLVSNDSREILLGFLGVESFVDDYVFAGINAAGNTVDTREIYVQWGFEERRHGQTFRHALIDSGLYTQEWVDKYLAQAADDHWTFQRQMGFEGSPLDGAAYAIFQERHTRWNYTALRMRLWNEYGSPVDEAGRQVFPAIAGAIRFPETDEGAHEGNFSSIVRIHLKYLPDQALESLMKVSNRYRMPAVQLPNGDQFVEAVLAAGMGSARDVINQVLNPALAKMGLDGRHALRRAVENFQNLPEGGVVQLPGKPIRDLPKNTASAVYEMQPTGEFKLVSGEGKLLPELVAAPHEEPQETPES
ncbi:MAG: hypothetical protein EXR67_00275 [Dehalococcoidia bacterium]|nr:hypothetical protein [Dehalococcoidia bacterium]